MRSNHFLLKWNWLGESLAEDIWKSLKGNWNFKIKKISHDFSYLRGGRLCILPVAEMLHWVEGILDYKTAHFTHFSPQKIFDSEEVLTFLEHQVHVCYYSSIADVFFDEEMPVGCGIREEDLKNLRFCL